MNKPKSLGQIAYEAHGKAGLQYDALHPWEEASLYVQSIYKQIAKAVAQEIERRRKEKENEQ